MDYGQAIRYITSLDVLGMRFGLERMRRLLAALGDPQNRVRAIQVVGTNGKTSTTRLCAAILHRHGYHVGAYTSPHVVGWNERIEIDGAALMPDRFARAVGEVAEAAHTVEAGGGDPITQFELLTAVAFHVFAGEGCDAMVVEAGLGGRYDATNVLDGGEVTVLTNIALEHTHLLGSTVEAIAGEKLAVAPKDSTRLVVGELDAATAPAIRRVMDQRELSGWVMGRDFGRTEEDGVLQVDIHANGVRERYDDLRPGMRGGFQADNVAAAVAAARRFHGAPLNQASVADAVADVRVPGRLEEFPGKPRIILDAAHNPAGMWALVDALPTIITNPVVVVLALLDDKDAEAMISIIARRQPHVVATRSRHPRSVEPAGLAELARAHGLDATVVHDAEVALARAQEQAGEGGTVLVCGSLYLLADLRAGLVAERGGS